jgi:alpha-methylacyl-CoA racemase
MTGPLKGLKIIEIAGIGPGPFGAMMLADHGAHVIRIERPEWQYDPSDVLVRSREVMRLDLRKAESISKVRDLVREADGLIEGLRPGKMERLGLGPDVLLSDNSRLVYARMTGWGQFGPYAHSAGHDINYTALSGALHSIGRRGQRPTPPPALVGDFGGGGMLLAFGMLAAILHARATNQGQVVDCAMTDGSGLLMAIFYGLHAAGKWHDDRGCNTIDTGAHFYDSYETADGKFITIGAIEAKFYHELRARLGLLQDSDFDEQNDQSRWPVLKQRMVEIFATKTRHEWCALLENTDVCFAPVLSLGEAPSHPHNIARAAFSDVSGVVQPSPAPRYSISSLDPPVPPRVIT